MTFVVGVDGGGTKARAVVLDADGRELARAEGPGAVVTVESPEAAVDAVRHAIVAAVAEARASGTRVPETPAARLWAGLAGAGRPEARRLAEERLAASGLADVVEVGTDAEAAFHDAFDGGPGILLIAGTGSIALGRTAEGDWLRVGGWGHRVGDEGSGWAVGAAALRAVLHAADGRGPATALRDRVLDHCRVAEPEGLVEWAETATKADVARLVPLLAACAEEGDEAATAIVADAVASLTRHVAAMLARPKAGWTEPVPCVLWGGLVADANGPLSKPVRAALARYPVDLLERPLDPPAGAARMALAGWRRGH